jgi:hypothetical protein
MSTPTKRKLLPGITVVPVTYDYSKDPFVVKKLENARAFFAKHGLPEDLKARQAKTKKA